MGFKEDNAVFEEIVVQTGKAMLADGQDPWKFAELLELKDYQNAYKMLSDSQKSKYSVDEFEKFSTEDPIDNNPKPSNFQEEQMPYKKVAIQFATFLVNKDYENARDMLTEELKKEYTNELLQKEMIDMTDYFEDPNNIWVDINYVEEGGALDDRWIYVPICEDGNPEAVTVEIHSENGKECIGGIEWRRP